VNQKRLINAAFDKAKIGSAIIVAYIYDARALTAANRCCVT
jgi:hypothetical protein